MASLLEAVRRIGRNERVRAAVLPVARRALTGRTVTVLSGQGKGIRLVGAGSNPGYWFGNAEMEVQALFARILRPGMVVWDVGAGVGFQALLAARLVAPDGLVVALEPSPGARAMLEANVAGNPEGRLVRVVAVAAASENGRVALGESVLIGTGRHTVAGVRLDALDAPPPDLVKIDVDGGGASVLEGMTGLFSTRKPLVVLELHGAAEAGCGSFLEGHGYRLAQVNTGGMPHILAEPVPKP